VSSDDDILRQEISDRLKAREVAGFLRQLERTYGNPENRPDQLRESVRNSLGNHLREAMRILGEDHPSIDIVFDLLSPCVAAEPVGADLVMECAGLIAQALEDRFDVQPGGGHGGYYFSITGLLRSTGRRSPDLSVDT
jgi:hypothetical protein